MWNKCKVILITNNQEVNIILDKDKLEFIENKQVANTINSSVKGYHLYIISEDEIKESDWFIDTTNNHIIKALFTPLPDDCKKIIATTNKDLVTRYDERFKDVTINNNSLNQLLPQIPQQFIEQYITEYNQGNIISDVLVEYIQSADSFYGLNVPMELVTKQDNTINIKTAKDSLYHGQTLEYWKNNAEEDYAKVPISVLKYITVLEEAVKDSFNRDEVVELLESLKQDIPSDYSFNLKEWIEQNL